ncbi:hypothetical protein Dsin_008362 [Dipteronia sinensis]|uniref:MULE transposase domain-containing protein n=1 Tax=Dipteronia sinensis TaxID=43782 RepID=A0AAE0APR9_9ROSI|nr:hypothetical protein Dsin_008362 [Dipteronia sinensis]
MSWLLVQCGEHWKGNRFTGPISFSVRLTKKDNGAYNELMETIYERTEVSREKAELKLTSHVKTEDDTVTLSIMSDDDVEFVIIQMEKAAIIHLDHRLHLDLHQQAMTRSDSSKTSDTEDEIGDDDGDLLASKFGCPGHRIRPKDIVSDMREQHGIHLSYNKAYRSKEHALNQVFGDPWESFQRLPVYFYVLEQSNPGTVTKFRTDSKNRFKYGCMVIGASIEEFNSVIRPVICIDATHLKARTMGVLLVAVCKDENEMIYPLAFGFANTECTESWTWFLKKLRKLIQYPDRVMLVPDRHNGIFNAMEAIFPDAAHGICAYHLAQNLKRFCKQRDDVIWLYYHATYAYRIEQFDLCNG